LGKRDTNANVRVISESCKKLKKGVANRAKDPKGNKAFQSMMRGQMRDMNKTGRGAQARKATFVDKKTKRLVLDTPTNRKRYGASNVKKVK
jgi:hypothetical protein